MAHGKGKHQPNKAASSAHSENGAERHGCEQKKPKKLFWRDYEPLEKFNCVLVILGFISSGIAVGSLLIAHGSLNISRDALRDAQRAFMFASTGVTIAPNPPDEPSANAHLIVAIGNSGTTPAMNVRINGNKRVTIGELAPDFDFPDSPDPESPNIFPPKSDRPGLILPISSQCIPLIKSGKVRLFVWGTISYADIFGGNHQTQFCWKYMGSASNLQGTLKADLFVTCDRHNCADKDCQQDNNGRTERQADDACMNPPPN